MPATPPNEPIVRIAYSCIFIPSGLEPAYLLHSMFFGSILIISPEITGAFVPKYVKLFEIYCPI